MISVSLVPGININLNLLETFRLVAEYRGFTAAAKRSGRSVSAISSQIKQLESQLGVTLFSRTTRSLTLTEEGSILLASTNKAVAEFRRGLLQVYNKREEGASTIRVVCASFASWGVMPGIVQKFHARNRKTQLEVFEMPFHRFAETLISGDAAIGIGVIESERDDLEYEHLTDSPIVALVPSSLPQSRLSSMTLNEFAKLPLILPGSLSVTRRRLEAALEQENVKLNVVHDFAELPLALSMVEAGTGVAASTLLSVNTRKQSGFRAVPLQGRGLSVPIGVIWAKGHDLTPLQRQFVEFARLIAPSWGTTDLS